VATCPNCPQPPITSLDTACASGVFQVALVSVEQDVVNNQTILTYNLCTCNQQDFNLNQAFISVCPTGQGPQLNEAATNAANDASMEANFVGIVAPNQGQNPFNTPAAFFTSLNEQCQNVILVYNGIFLPTQIQNPGVNVVAGLQGNAAEFEVSISGLFNCAEEPVVCPFAFSAASMEQALVDAMALANTSGDPDVIERILRLIIKKEIVLELLLDEICP
jgi:hypothetical protein